MSYVKTEFMLQDYKWTRESGTANQETSEALLAEMRVVLIIDAKLRK